ncbi:hypothetical protein FOA52_002817 [Chlamydomonas sp. UWO 241]|nr:hypothetical protein FOA52_002817 [Chlamydomonas sp. UWO 241]
MSVFVSAGGVARLGVDEVLERVVTSAEVTDIEVDILMVVLKALCNITVDDVAEGTSVGLLQLQLPLSEDEVNNLEAIIEHATAAPEFSGQSEVAELAALLMEQLGVIGRKLEGGS